MIIRPCFGIGADLYWYLKIFFCGSNYLLEVIMGKTTQHVVPSPKGGWSVKKGGADKATKNFATKDKAVDYAKGVAKNQESELVIHGKDGKIQTHMAMIPVCQRILSKALDRFDIISLWKKSTVSNNVNQAIFCKC